MVSYPLQFFVPMERIEKWVTRKIPVEKQTQYIYFARYGIVLLTCSFFHCSLISNRADIFIKHKTSEKLTRKNIFVILNIPTHVDVGI